MLKRTAMAALISTALLTSAALAQTATTPSTSTPPAVGSGTSAPATMAPSAGGKFLTDQAIGQFRASKFVGVDIYGSENEKIGDISEVLLDGTGNAQAIVIGVGGFLGIGQKNVAVPFSTVEWMNTRPASMGTATTGSNTMPASALTGTPATSPAASSAMNRPEGAAGTAAAAPERNPSEQATYNGYPDHGVVRMTKADLQNAPEFKYYADTHARTGAPSNATGSPLTTNPTATR